jgi:hypothetical protein
MASVTFTQAFDRQSDMVPGENGNLEYKRSGTTFPASLVDLSYKLVRGIPREEAIKKITQSMVKINGNHEAVIDLFVLCFNTRSTRNLGGGKGERDLFFWFLIHLAKTYPKEAISIIAFIPVFGRWLDLNDIAWDPECPPEFSTALMTYYATEVRKVYTVLKETPTANVEELFSPAHVWLFKWLPSERKKHHKQNKQLWERLVVAIVRSSNDWEGHMKRTFDGLNIKDVSFNTWFQDRKEIQISSIFTDETVGITTQEKRRYREMLTHVRKLQGLPETHMSNNKWDAIENIPAGCMSKFSKALLNEKVHSVCPDEMYLTGNRFPEDTRRVTLRTKLMQKIKDGQLAKNQDMIALMKKLVDDALGRMKMVSRLEKELVEECWKKLLEQITTVERNRDGYDIVPSTRSSTIRPGTILPMCDVSGSMTGYDMPVIGHAMALSIFLSQLNKGAFQDRILTFHSYPTCVNLSECTSIYDKFETLIDAPWGMNTNLWKAIELIHHIIRKHQIPPTEVPEWLAIFSDMQFDESQESSWDTTVETINSMVKKLNEEKWVKTKGWVYKRPGILFWNLRGDTVRCGVPAKSNDSDIIMWGGYNPAMLRVLMFEEDLPATTDKEEVTPEMILQKILQHADFAEVRKALREAMRNCV